MDERIQAYMAEYAPGRVSEHMRSFCRDEAKRLLRQAELLMEQTFIFEDRWDMEPCRTPYTIRGEMVWDQSPNGDPEWVYMLNRHDWLKKLFIAWRLTGRQEYLEKLKAYLLDWIRKNPITGRAGETTRSIDTGIRCMNWFWLLLHLIGEELLTPAQEEEIFASAGAQLAYLKEGYIEKYSLSNWGILQTTAICHGYLWFGGRFPAGGIEAWAWEELKNQLELQVMGDGSHWEQSIMYHIEVLNAVSKLWASCMAIGRPEASCGRLADAVRAMSAYVQYAAAPDHCQPAQCDSDVTDVRDVLSRSAVLCRDSRFRFGGYEQLDLESAWLLGAEGVREYKHIIPAEPEVLNRSFPDTGNLYLRSSWREEASYTCMQNGPLGSGHGHADLTHISIYYRGKPFLSDSGRYTYREDEPLRAELKSAAAHNVCVIDGDPQGAPVGSWSYTSYGSCLKNYFSSGKTVHYAELPYYSHLKDHSLYLAVRKVVVIDPAVWLVWDDISCGGSHVAKTYYHLDGGVRAVPHGEGWSLEADPGGPALRVSSGPGEYKAQPCVISPEYNLLCASEVLVKKQQFTDRYLGWTAFTGEGITVKDAPVFVCGSEEPVRDSLVTAKEFVLSEEESWVAVIWHEETFRGPKLYVCKGVPVYGKAAVLHRVKGEYRRIRLRN